MVRLQAIEQPGDPFEQDGTRQESQCVSGRCRVDHHVVVSAGGDTGDLEEADDLVDSW